MHAAASRSKAPKTKKKGSNVSATEEAAAATAPASAPSSSGARATPAVTAASAKAANPTVASKSGLEVPPHPEPALTRFMASHRAASKNWVLPQRFPDGGVLRAYMEPKVDESRDRFEFRTPDITILRQYCQQRFAWNAVPLP
jgi:hypothetical protein